MSWKSPTVIISLAFVGVSIICFALIGVLSWLSIVGSVCITIAFALLVWITFIDYLVYKRQKADQKLSDAYLYAEKFGDEEMVKEFSYDRKTLRKLRYEKFNHFIIPLAFLTLTFFGVSLTIVCTRII